MLLQVDFTILPNVTDNINQLMRVIYKNQQYINNIYKYFSTSVLPLQLAAARTGTACVSSELAKINSRNFNIFNSSSILVTQMSDELDVHKWAFL